MAAPTCSTVNDIFIYKYCVYNVANGSFCKELEKYILGLLLSKKGKINLSK